jgi:hypothetical protein
VSRFFGLRQWGAHGILRRQSREEAEARNVKTPPERRSAKVRKRA